MHLSPSFWGVNILAHEIYKNILVFMLFGGFGLIVKRNWQSRSQQVDNVQCLERARKKAVVRRQPTMTPTPATTECFIHVAAEIINGRVSGGSEGLAASKSLENVR